jgi:hypothetical protein
MKVMNLQRGTAFAVELGGKPPCASAAGNMTSKWAGGNSFFVQGSYAFVHCSKFREKNTKKRAAGKNQGPIGMKAINLQRGTAAAVELGGKSHRMHQLSAIWWFNGQSTMINCA